MRLRHLGYEDEPVRRVGSGVQYCNDFLTTMLRESFCEAYGLRVRCIRDTPCYTASTGVKKQVTTHSKS